MTVMNRLDKLIFIGFTPPPDEFQATTSQRIMNAYNVLPDNVRFFPDETPPSKIVTGSFLRDDSQKYGYRIGQALCVVSGNVSQAYRKKVGRLTAMGVSLQTGVDHVDVWTLNEDEMKHWRMTGQYQPMKAESAEKGAGLLGSLLSSDTDDDFSEPLPPSTPPAASHTPRVDVDAPFTSVFKGVADDTNDDRIVSGLQDLHSRAPLSTHPLRGDEDTSDWATEQKVQRRRAQMELNKKVHSLDEQVALERQDRAREHFEKDQKDREFSHQADSVSAIDKKTFKDYLSAEQRAEQTLMEEQQRDFGNVSNATIMSHEEQVQNINDFKDQRFVGAGTGRIIVVTAGKGGVGKTLVATGISAALSLAKAKERETVASAATSAPVWLIESDYMSPNLSHAYQTGKKHLGNVADMFDSERVEPLLEKARRQGRPTTRNALLRQAIKDNVFVDEATGVRILACPPLVADRLSSSLPLAILTAIKYASDNGGDVIVDHGQLTRGEHSTFDREMFFSLAHRAILVADMSCLRKTMDALSVLCDRAPGSTAKRMNIHAVSVVMNSAREQQVIYAQKSIAPYAISGYIPPLDALRAENSMTGSTYFKDAPADVKKAVLVRLGKILVKHGYQSLDKYFTTATFTGKKSRTAQTGGLVKRIMGKMFK